MALTHTPICEFGLPAPDFRLPDYTGTLHSRDGLLGPNGLLVMFICNHCPYVQAINAQLVRDAQEILDLGIGVVAIMPNDLETYPQDGPQYMRTVAEKYGYPFPYLVDETQAVARSFGAVCTPDFFGYNHQLELQYRGRLDDAPARGDHQAARRELVEAMRLIADTGTGPRQQVASMGCSIKWREDG